MASPSSPSSPPQQPPQSPLSAFFSRYKAFTPTPTTTEPPPDFSLPDEFARLVAQQGWPPNSRALARARREYRAALIDEFNFMFGIDSTDLASWQTLCRVVGVRVEDLPGSVKQCRKVRYQYSQSYVTIKTNGWRQLMASTHVNLMDLVETRYAGRSFVRRFSTLRALKEDMLRSKKCFPREAKKGGVLGALLRDLGHTPV